MIKKKLSLLLFIIATCISVYGQNRLISDNLPIWLDQGNDTYIANIEFRIDITGFSYGVKSIEAGHKVFTSLEQLYDIESISNVTDSTISLLVKDNLGFGMPFGQVMVFDTLYKNRKIPQIPFEGEGSSSQFQSAVDTWNAKADSITIEFISNSSHDTILQYLNVPANNSYVAAWNSGTNSFNWVLIEANNADTIVFNTDFIGQGTIDNPIAFSSKGASETDIMTWNGTEFVPVASTNGIYDSSDSLIENTKVFLDDNYFSIPLSSINDTFMVLTNGIEYAYIDGGNNVIKLNINEIKSLNSNIYSLNGIGDQTSNASLNSTRIYKQFNGTFDPEAAYVLLYDETTNKIEPFDILSRFTPTGWLKDSLSNEDVKINGNAHNLLFNNLDEIIIASSNISGFRSINNSIFIGINYEHNRVKNSIIGGNGNITGSFEPNSNRYYNIVMYGLQNDMFIDDIPDTIFNSATIASRNSSLSANNTLALGTLSEAYGDNMFIYGINGVSTKDNSFAKGIDLINFGTQNPLNDVGRGCNVIVKLPLPNRWSQNTNTFTTIATYQLDTTRRANLIKGTLSVAVENSDNNINGLKEGEIITRHFNAAVLNEGANAIVVALDTTSSDGNFATIDTTVISLDGNSFIGTGFNITRSGNILNFRFKPGSEINSNGTPVTFKSMLDLKISSICLKEFVGFVPSACDLFESELVISENSGVLTYNDSCNQTLTLNWTLPDNTTVNAITTPSVNLVDIGTYTVSGTCDTCFAEDSYLYCDGLFANINKVGNFLQTNTSTCNATETFTWTNPSGAISNNSFVLASEVGDYTLNYDCGGCNTTVTYSNCDDFIVEIERSGDTLRYLNTNCDDELVGFWTLPDNTTIDATLFPELFLTNAESGTYSLFLSCGGCSGNTTFTYLGCDEVFAIMSYDEVADEITVNDSCAQSAIGTITSSNGLSVNYDQTINNPDYGAYLLNYQCDSCSVLDTIILCPPESTFEIVRLDSCSFNIRTTEDVFASLIRIDVTDPNGTETTFINAFSFPYDQDIDVVDDFNVISGDWIVEVTLQYFIGGDNPVTAFCDVMNQTIQITDPCDSFQQDLIANTVNETITSEITGEGGDLQTREWYVSDNFGIIATTPTVSVATHGYGVYKTIARDIYNCADGLPNTADDLRCETIDSLLYCPENSDLNLSMSFPQPINTTIINFELTSNNFAINNENGDYDITITHLDAPQYPTFDPLQITGANNFNVDIDDQVHQGEITVSTDYNLNYEVPLTTPQEILTCGPYNETQVLCYVDYGISWNAIFSFQPSIGNVWQFTLPYYITDFTYIIQYDTNEDGSPDETQAGNQVGFVEIFGQSTLPFESRTWRNNSVPLLFPLNEADITVSISWTHGSCSGTYVRTFTTG